MREAKYLCSRCCPLLRGDSGARAPARPPRRSSRCPREPRPDEFVRPSLRLPRSLALLPERAVSRPSAGSALLQLRRAPGTRLPRWAEAHRPTVLHERGGPQIQARPAERGPMRGFPSSRSGGGGGGVPPWVVPWSLGRLCHRSAFWGGYGNQSCGAVEARRDAIPSFSSCRGAVLRGTSRRPSRVRGGESHAGPGDIEAFFLVGSCVPESPRTGATDQPPASRVARRRAAPFTVSRPPLGKVDAWIPFVAKARVSGAIRRATRELKRAILARRCTERELEGERGRERK